MGSRLQSPPAKAARPRGRILFGTGHSLNVGCRRLGFGRKSARAGAEEHPCRHCLARIWANIGARWPGFGRAWARRGPDLDECRLLARLWANTGAVKPRVALCRREEPPNVRLPKHEDCAIGAWSWKESACTSYRARRMRVSVAVMVRTFGRIIGHAFVIVALLGPAGIMGGSRLCAS